MRVLMLHTNLEQSQQLIDLGLDPSTADIHLSYPAWSLTRLVELSTSLSVEKSINVETAQPGDYKMISYNQEFDDIKHSELNNKLMNSVLNLVKWLLSNHYIK